MSRNKIYAIKDGKPQVAAKPENKEDLFEVRELNREYHRKRNYCADTVKRLTRLIGLDMRELEIKQSDAMMAVQEFQFEMEEKHARAFKDLPRDMLDEEDRARLSQLNKDIADALRERDKRDRELSKKHKLDEWQTLQEKYERLCCEAVDACPQDVDWQKGTARVRKDDKGFKALSAELEAELVNQEPQTRN